MQKVKSFRPRIGGSAKDVQRRAGVSSKVRKSDGKLPRSGHRKSPDSFEEDNDMVAESASEDDEQLACLDIDTVKMWERKLGTKVTFSLLESVFTAFTTAVAQCGVELDEYEKKYRIVDGRAFNAVLKLCFSNFPHAWNQFMALKHDHVPSKKEKRDERFKALQPLIKNYLKLISKFLPHVQDSEVRIVLLKHLTQIADYCATYDGIARALLRPLIETWSSKEESARVLAFLCIIKLVRMFHVSMIDLVLRKMYLQYARNAKVITIASWPSIKFMQKSFAETCRVNMNVSYYHAFMYIRQLAIHLRNGLMEKSKGTPKAVYNWSFVQCISLWCSVLTSLHNDPMLSSLIYPLIQVAIGCIRLRPIAKFFPLRFHILRSLISLERQLDIYVPILPLVYEVFRLVDFNQRPRSAKPRLIDFSCVLRLSSSSVLESSFKTATISHVTELITECAYTHCCSASFPELVMLCIHQLKQFCKTCRRSNYNSEIKHLCTRLQEQSRYIEERRKTFKFDLKNAETMKQFEAQIRASGDVPFFEYYSAFRKMKDREFKMKLDAADEERNKLQEEPKDELVDEEIESPAVKKKRLATAPDSVEQAQRRVPKKQLEAGEDMITELNLSDSE